LEKAGAAHKVLKAGVGAKRVELRSYFEALYDF
jgi:hypothetical protein